MIKFEICNKCPFLVTSIMLDKTAYHCFYQPWHKGPTAIKEIFITYDLPKECKRKVEQLILGDKNANFCL